MAAGGTTLEVTLDDDVARALLELQASQGLDVDSALNLLAREGMRMLSREHNRRSTPGAVVHDVLTVADDGPPFHPIAGR